jgi:ribose 5-phosphate isomerase RpiB
MKIGIIQASSQIEKNTILYECTKDYGEVINFGCFEDEENYSYVEIALEICLLISSQAVDFIVTGCSSGQGMMIACNSLPNLICGYLPTPQDAYLFGRINDGNVASLPLGLNYGWTGEINLKATLQQLFEEPFGIGYPLKDVKRKREDTKKIKALNQLCKKDIIEFLNEIDSSFINKVLSKKNVIDYILEQGKDQRIKQWILNRR